MKKIILALLLFATTTFAEDRKSLYFVTGYTLNEYSYFHKTPSYKDELKARLMILKENHELKEVSDLLNVIVHIDADKDKETFLKTRTAIIAITEHLSGEDQLNFSLGFAISEIVVLTVSKKSAPECIELIKLIAEKLHDTDNEISKILFEIVKLDDDDKLTEDALLSKLKDLAEAYKRRQNFKNI